MFKEKLKLVPHLPGSYQMKNIDGIIIYVGKAKDLNKRLSSYFRGNVTGKTAKMVSEVHNFEYIVASSELESFLIEINLIKQYNPKYNIDLTDDKSYPYIEYISKPFPKLKVSRYLQVRKKDNKKLFGPYPNAYAARRIVNLLNRIYPLKKCNSMPKKVCLYYHIEECLGYCEKNTDQMKIKQVENDILSFLGGNDKILKEKIEEKMFHYSDNMNFEMALELKKELEYISIILDKQKIEFSDRSNRDVYAFYADKGYISIQIFFIRNGKLVGGHSDIVPLISEIKDDAENYLVKFYEKHEIPKEILIPSEIDSKVLNQIVNTTFITPLKGKKKQLVEMAILNSQVNLENELELILKDESKTENANEELRELLKMNVLDRIDIFDNSNLFGTFTVSGMVVFKNGRPAKNEYRKYKISIDKNDDYNTMKEVIYRRYYRALVDKLPLPDLIIVDGGKNQINATLDVLDDLRLDIKVCGLKKNDKHKTSELVDENQNIINIQRTSNVFHYLTRMQDEVHRFTINYHRQIRSKGSISSILDNVAGIGEKRKKQLIKTFGSITKMKEATLEDLEKILPSATANALQKFLKEQ